MTTTARAGRKAGRVAVLGAGIVGVTTAWELLRDGHEVVVVDRREGPALETSWGNAGLIAPGHAFAWASPKVPKILLKSLFDERQAFRLRFSADPAFWRWTLQFLGQCTSERARINTLRKHRLCRYSQAVLQETVQALGLDYHRVGGGLLYLYRSQAGLERGLRNMRILAEDGQRLEAIEPERAVALEPALAAARPKLAGAVRVPDDESGDCHRFACGLAERCAAGGVTFRYGTTIRRLVAEGERIVRLETDQGPIEAEAFVLALGSWTPRLLRPLGVALPVYPVKGYSLTLPVPAGATAPLLGGVDEDNLVAYARFGDRLRVTATAEFAGYDLGHRPKDFAPMLAAIRDLFPEGADWERPTYWTGLRPMTPQGTPIFGRARHANLWLNCGQGHMGWTMAHGSARIAADLLAGRKPQVPLDGMTLA